jgi:hypothetical protein
MSGIDHRRRWLLLALAAAPMALAFPRLPARSSMTVGEAIAWLHHVGFRQSALA